MKQLFLLIFICIVGYKAQAQIARSYSNEFLSIGVGARAMALGKSVSSFQNGVESGYWNPAGMVNVKGYEFSAMHNSLFNGIGSYDYFGVAMPLEEQNIVVAASFIRLGVDNILNTTNLIDNNGLPNFNRVTRFSSSDIAAIFSVAKTFSKINLHVGANAKIIRRNIGDFAKGNGFGFDIGAQYQLGKVKLGLMIRDVTTTFTAWSVDDAIFDAIANAPVLADNGTTSNTTQNQEKPEKYELTLPKFQLGASYLKPLRGDYSLLTAVELRGRFVESNDLISTKSISFSPSVGLELSYKNSVFLRTGFGNFQNETDFTQTENAVEGATITSKESISFEPNIGVGIRYKKVFIDYALTNLGANSGVNFSNVFSLKILFDKK